MSTGRRHLVREHAFLIAAIALPVLVALLFVGANTLSRATVPPPAYSLVLRAARPYTANPSVTDVSFIVRGGRIEAVVRLAPPQSHAPRWGLLIFDHESMQVREIPLDLPEIVTEGETRTIPVDALAGRRVIDDVAAPDGYRLDPGPGGRSGIVGNIFGMGRSSSALALVHDGRAIALDLPPPYDTGYPQLAVVGWIDDEGR